MNELVSSNQGFSPESLSDFDLSPIEQKAAHRIADALRLYFQWNGHYSGTSGSTVRGHTNGMIAVYILQQMSVLAHNYADTPPMQSLEGALEKIMRGKDVVKQLDTIEARAKVIHDKAIEGMTILDRVDPDRVTAIFSEPGAAPKYYRFGPGIIDCEGLNLKLWRTERGHLKYGEIAPWDCDWDRDERIVFQMRPMEFIALKKTDKITDVVASGIDNPANEMFFKELAATPSFESLQARLTERGLASRLSYIFHDVIRKMDYPGMVHSKFNPEGSMILAVGPKHQKAMLPALFIDNYGKHKIEPLSALFAGRSPSLGARLRDQLPLWTQRFLPNHPVSTEKPIQPMQKLLL